MFNGVSSRYFHWTPIHSMSIQLTSTCRKSVYVLLKKVIVLFLWNLVATVSCASTLTFIRSKSPAPSQPVTLGLTVHIKAKVTLHVSTFLHTRGRDECLLHSRRTLVERKTNYFICFHFLPSSRMSFSLHLKEQCRVT